MVEIISDLAEISARYDAVLCDLWGCVHDGVTAFPEAIAALQTYRAQGGTVLLLTNAPRARAVVAEHLAQLDVPDTAWDVIATSGDSARAAMFQGAVGQRIYFIGEAPRDLHFFDPMSLVADAAPIERVALEDAEGIVCTGPFDPTADPDTLRPQLLHAKTRGLKLLCANPDLVVDRGARREWCAGKVAELYTEMGGESLYFGKPHPPIYDLARQRLMQFGRDVPDDRILAIGDGMGTDIAGGAGEGIDTLFVTGGLARQETATQTHPDAAKLDAFLATGDVHPTYAIGMLR
ncbi:MAG: TIGR01459 family HAD-type hydrolase [Pseudomonadota bacterium]